MKLKKREKGKISLKMGINFFERKNEQNIVNEESFLTSSKKKKFFLFLRFSKFSIEKIFFWGFF